MSLGDNNSSENFRDSGQRSNFRLVGSNAVEFGSTTAADQKKKISIRNGSNVKESG